MSLSRPRGFEYDKENSGPAPMDMAGNHKRHGACFISIKPWVSFCSYYVAFGWLQIQRRSEPIMAGSETEKRRGSFWQLAVIPRIFTLEILGEGEIFSIKSDLALGIKWINQLHSIARPLHK